MDAQYLITFVAEKRPGFRELHERCMELGLTSTHDGRTDVCGKYMLGLELRRDGMVDGAIAEIEEAERGTMYLWTDSGMQVGITVTDASARGEWWGRTRISFQTTEIDDRHQDEADIDTRIEELLDLVAALTPIVEPEFVWSAVSDDTERYQRVIPDGRPIKDHVTDLSWVTVMSESVIEQFGGREHVLATPAWRVEELDSGHVMIVTDDHPYDPVEGGDWKAHLFRN